MFSGIQFLGEWLVLALWSAGLMFLVGLLAWALSRFLDQPLARWAVVAVAIIGLVCFHGWDVWFQSDPATWVQHMAERDRFNPTREQGVKLIWASFWGGIAGLVLAGIVERWFSGSVRY